MPFVMYGMKRRVNEVRVNSHLSDEKHNVSLLSNQSCKDITYFSDTCGGQNRNKFVAVSLLYCITVLQN